VRVHLSAVVSTQDDSEVVLGIGGLEECEVRVLLLGHCAILANVPWARKTG
jgi:hypothetical protein